MSVLNQVCANWSDVDAQLAGFKSELAGIEADFNKQVNDIVNSPDEKILEDQADAALDYANSFFAMQPIGGFNAALKDSNIVAPTTGSSTSSPGAKVIEDLGYVYLSGRYWICNSTLSAQQPKATPTPIYGYIGVGEGIATPDKISELLGRAYNEPAVDVIENILKRVDTTLSTSPSQDSSITGSRTQSGNISSLREFYRGCNSNPGILSDFLADSYKSGFGALWSTSTVVLITKPSTLASDQFNIDYIRKQLDSVIFQDDVMILDDNCYVRTEQFIGYNLSRKQVKLKVNALEASLGLPIDSMSLLTRTIKFNPNEDVTSGAPVLVSRGCKASDLSTKNYTIGMSVNGIYRVIDVTGDEGLNIIHDTYSVYDIVDSITEVFGDLVECGVVGDDFFIKLKPGFGANGTISLFWSGDLDCSTIIGLQATIHEAVKARSLVNETQTQVPELKTAIEITWQGGASTVSTTPSSFFIDFLNADNLYPETKTALLTQASYWDSISPVVKSLSSALDTACQQHQTKSQASNIKGLEEYLCYFDCEGFNYREYLTMSYSLGSELHNLLVNKLNISGLNTYTSKATVRDSLTQTLTSLLNQDGIIGSTGAASQASLPLELNYALSARLRLLQEISTQYAYVDDTQAQQAAQDLCSYSTAVDVSNNVLITKTNSASTFSKIMDGMDAITENINSFTNDDLNRVIWNLLKETPGISSLFDAASYLDSKVNAIGTGLDAGFSKLEDMVSNLMSSLGLSNLNRKAIGILLQIKACLTTAQAIGARLSALYNALTKKILALSNFNLNFSGSLGFQSKYLSCYATGTISATPLMFLAKMLGVLNDMADALNKRLESMRKAAQFSIDKILCVLDKLVLSMTGTMSYESISQAGTVSMSFQCTSYIPLGELFKPEILKHIMDIRNQIDNMLASFQLNVVTFKKHEENLDAVKSGFTNTLEQTVNDLLDKLRKCF